MSLHDEMFVNPTSKERLDRPVIIDRPSLIFSDVDFSEAPKLRSGADGRRKAGDGPSWDRRRLGEAIDGGGLRQGLCCAWTVLIIQKRRGDVYWLDQGNQRSESEASERLSWCSRRVVSLIPLSWTFIHFVNLLNSFFYCYCWRLLHFEIEGVMFFRSFLHLLCNMYWRHENGSKWERVWISVTNTIMWVKVKVIAVLPISGIRNFQISWRLSSALFAKPCV